MSKHSTSLHPPIIVPLSFYLQLILQTIPRLTPDISGGAMADIAFLLLLFFMVSTTIMNEQGIKVTLPEWEEKAANTPINKPILSIKLNFDSKCMIDGNKIELNELSNYIYAQLTNLKENQITPIISFASSENAYYDEYLNVYNEIRIAFKMHWSEKGLSTYNKQWNNLNTKEKNNIKRKWKMIISEAEACN